MNLILYSISSCALTAVLYIVGEAFLRATVYTVYDESISSAAATQDRHTHQAIHHELPAQSVPHTVPLLSSQY